MRVWQEYDRMDCPASTWAQVVSIEDLGGDLSGEEDAVDVLMRHDVQEKVQRAIRSLPEPR